GIPNPSRRVNEEEFAEEEGMDYFPGQTVGQVIRKKVLKRRSSQEKQESAKKLKISTELESCGPECNLCDVAYLGADRSKTGLIPRKNTDYITPHCMVMECMKHPSTLTSYAEHLKKDHNSSLIQLGYILRCECGVEVQSKKTGHKHNQTCAIRNFTIHKLNEEDLP
ncbi:hypothetical protein PMAYCL1PPCAC_07867, partial [Pristionchus mayeri]